MFNFAKQVDILGSNYDIIVNDEKKVPRLNEETEGLCYINTKQIVINNKINIEILDELENKDVCLYKQKVLRHEIIHAYAEESGIPDFDEVDNEITVDWIAKQAPKILISCLESGALSKDVVSKIAKIINHQYDDNFAFINNN